MHLLAQELLVDPTTSTVVSKTLKYGYERLVCIGHCTALSSLALAMLQGWHCS